MMSSQSVAVDVNDEAVVTESALGGTALDLRQVQIASGETTENAVKRSRAVGILKTDNRRPVPVP
jgi:hypothetical protein